MPFVPLVFSHLVSWSPALTALADMGFASVRYTDGYIIAREPRMSPLREPSGTGAASGIG